MLAEQRGQTRILAIDRLCATRSSRRLPSAIMGALADALPGNVVAPGFDDLWDTHIAGGRQSLEHFSYT